MIVKTAARRNKDYVVEFVNTDSNSDFYELKIYLRRYSQDETDFYKIRLLLVGNILAYPALEMVWTFGEEQFELASRVFHRICDESDEIKVEFDSSRMPVATLSAKIREYVKPISSSHQENKHQVPLNEAQKLPGVSDWRQSIYSNRYPNMSKKEKDAIKKFEGNGAEEPLNRRTYKTRESYAESEGIVKEASKQADFVKDGADVYSLLIQNNERYGSDTHRIWIIKTATENGLSLVLEIKSERDGMLSYSEYWHYSKEEEAQIDINLKGLLKIGQEIKGQIEISRLPTALIAPLFRTATRYFDVDHKEKSKGVICFNYDIDNPKETDWRQSIYGDRYRQALNQNPVEFKINEQEHQKKVIETGTTSRNKVVKYTS